MSSITVVYDSIEKSVPVVEALADDCATLSGKVGEVSSELDSIGANHDSCFANSISAVEILSTFVTKMGAEYDAIAGFAKTATSTFKESEGKIIADTAKIEDMKTMLSYLGMSEASVKALNFDKINGYKTMDDYNKADDDHKADISLYEEYYKNTNADLGEVEESAILDMMVTSDGKGSYRTVTTEEMKKYIEERAKAQATAEAQSTVTGPGASVGTAAAVSSGVASAATSSGTSSGTSSSSTSSSDKEEEKAKDKEKEKEKDTKEEEEEVLDEDEKTNEELDNKIKELEAKEKELQEKLDKAKKETEGSKETPKDDTKSDETKADDTKAETKSEEKKETTVVKNVKASKPKTSKAATNNAQSVGNVSNNSNNTSTPAPEQKTKEVPVEPTEEVPKEPVQEEVPEDPSIEETPQEDTSRTTIPLPTEDSKKSGSSSSVIPAIAGIATAAAAGIGTKIYLDKKANSDDDYEGEDEEYYDEYDDNSSSELSEGSSIQSPDSTWDSSQEDSNLKY